MRRNRILILLWLGLMPPVVLAQDSKLEQEHALLRGTWEIQSITENGERLGKELLDQKMTRDGLVAFGRRMFRTVDPETGKFRDRAYRIDPSKQPKEIDVITETDEVLEGIYRFDGDNLQVCIRDQASGSRPTDFSSRPGENNLLIDLAMLPGPKEAAEAAEPPPPTVAPPSTAELRKSKDRELTQMLVGTWMHLDSQGTVTVSLRDDGTFTSTRSWSRPSRKLFVGTTVKTGRWSVTDGAINARVTGSTDRRDLDQVFTGQLQTVSPESVTYTDLFGRIQRSTRVR